MSIVVNFADLSLPSDVALSLHLQQLSAQNVEEKRTAITDLFQSIIKEWDTQQEELVKKTQGEFKNWLNEQIKDFPMKEASKLLNKNAWKIKKIELIPAFGEDPETEWTGFITFIDDDTTCFMTDSDDYRIILKKFAVVSEILDLGE